MVIVTAVNTKDQTCLVNQNIFHKTYEISTRNLTDFIYNNDWMKTE